MRISLKFVLYISINTKPALVQIMAWCLTGDKSLSKPMMAYFTDTYMRLSANTLKTDHMLPIFRTTWSTELIAGMIGIYLMSC